jgi:hypothetical protein
MQKTGTTQLFYFTEELDEFDVLQHYIHFKLDDLEENVITNHFLYFYDDLFFCQYTGFFLKLIIKNESEIIYKIISSEDINRMRSLMFTQISITEDIYGIYNRQQSYSYLAKNWNDLIPFDNKYNPWDVEVAIQQENPRLIKKNRGTSKYYLYVIRDVLTNMHKIGITSKLQKRYKTLLSDRFSLTVEQAYELDDKNTCYLLEKRLHKHFEKYKNIGEWFDLSHLSFEEIQNEIYNQSEELTDNIIDVDITWSYDDRYNIIDKTNGNR